MTPAGPGLNRMNHSVASIAPRASGGSAATSPGTAPRSISLRCARTAATFCSNHGVTSIRSEIWSAGTL